MTHEPPQDEPELGSPDAPPPAAPPPGGQHSGQYGGPGAPSAPPPGPPPPAGPPPGYPQAPAYPAPGTQPPASPPPGTPAPGSQSGAYGPPPTGAPSGPPSGYGAPPPQGPPPGYRPQPAPGYGPPAQAPGSYGAPPQGQGYGTPPPGYGGPPPQGPPAQGPPAGYGTPPPGYGAAQPQAGDPRWSAPTTGGGGYPAPGAGPDFKAQNPLDWGILAAGVLAMIFSFFGYYTASVRIGNVSISSSEGAWHGFFGWFAALIAFLAAGVLAVALFAPQSMPSIPHRLVTAAGFAVATICVLLALVVFPHSVPSGSGIDTGRGVGYWLSLIVIVAGLVLSVIRLRATGGKLPWDKGGATPPATGGYGPPS